MRDVLQDQLGSLPIFVELLEQQVGLEVPKQHNTHTHTHRTEKSAGGAETGLVGNKSPSPGWLQPPPVGEGGNPAREQLSLAQPVFFGSKTPPAVPLVEDHQPAVDRVEELQGFPLRILCGQEKASLREKAPRLPANTTAL